MAKADNTTAADTTEAKPSMVEVVLLKDLTQSGEFTPAGEKVFVPESNVEWLKETGTIS